MSLGTESAQLTVPTPLRFPISVADILRKRQSLKQELLKQTNLVSTRIAILGGSTTTEVRSMLELFLLAQGIQPTFYESGYNRYAEDIQFENPDLWSFKPDIVFVHTTWHNVLHFPELMESDTEVENACASRWHGSSLSGRKFIRGLVQSLSRTTSICPA